MSYFWPPERDEKLKALYAEGLPFSQIARQLGDCTRNAAIGRAGRLHLSGRPRNPKKRPKPARKPRVPAFEIPIIEPDALRLESGAFVTLLTAERVHCRFPCGDPLDADFHYCAQTVAPGARYCPHHYGRVYQAQPKRERPTQYKTWGSPI